MLDRKGALLLVGECLAAVLFAAAVAMTVQKIVGTIGIPRPSAVPTALSALVALVTIAVSFAILTKPGWGPARTVLAWAIPAACSAAVQTLVLSGSRFYLNGVNDDQLFRMQLFTRMASSLGASDGNYANLPSFYPVGWFWLGGRFADLVGVESWAAYKAFSIATMAVAPALAFAVWSRVVERKPAMMLSLAIVAVGLTVEAYEPYRWVVVVIVPPAVALAGAEFRRCLESAPRVLPGGTAVAVGLLLGLALSTYTLMFGVLVLGIVLYALVVLLRTGSERGVLADGGRIAPSLLVVWVVAAVVGLPVWGPYLIASLSHPSAGNGAARYFPDGSASLPFPMLEQSAIGLTSLAGVAWLIFGQRYRSVAVACAITASTCYVWHVFSTLALAARTSLLAVIVDSLLVLTLASAAVLGIWELVGTQDPERSPRRRVGLASALAGAVLFVSLTQSPSPLVAERLDATFSAFDDQGHRADGSPAHPAPDAPGSWNGEVLSTIALLSDRPPDELVLLTDDWPILVFRPFRSFQTIVQEYANPLALFPDRRTAIERWGTARTPQELTTMLDSSPFQAPDVFVLRKSPGGLAVQVSTNRFPRAQTNDFRDVVLDPRAFSGPGFVRRDVGPFAVIARR